MLVRIVSKALPRAITPFHIKMPEATLGRYAVTRPKTPACTAISRFQNTAVCFQGRGGEYLQQSWRFQCRAPHSALRLTAKLLTILPDTRRRRFEPDPDAATLLNVGTFRGNPPNNVLSRQNRCHYVA